MNKIILVIVSILFSFNLVFASEYDLNGDTDIDIEDLAILLDNFGSNQGSQEYLAERDFNQDLSIDILDFVILVNNFGTQIYQLGKSCEDINHDNCVEVFSCGRLSGSNSYFLLMNDVESENTCIVMTGATNSYFDLNGYTITYNTLKPDLINGGFEEDLSNGWTVFGDVERVSSASEGREGYLWGDYYIKMSNSPSQKNYLESAPVYLANSEQTYSSWVVVRSGYSSTPSFFIEIIDETNTVICRSETGSVDRTPGLECNFKISEPKTVRLRFGTLEHQNPYTFYVDFANIASAYDFGIISRNYCDSRRGPDDCPLSASDNIEIFNGKIIQGIGEGPWSEAIEISSMNAKIHDLITEVNGINSMNIEYYRPGVNIFDNILISKSPYVFNRMLIWAQIFASGSESKIFNNTILGGPQSGINIESGTSDLEIYNNYFNLSSKVTNNHAINTYGGLNLNIHDNTIISESGRGIEITGGQSAGARNSTIYNNYIRVKETPPFEYFENYELTCAHGIKLESNIDNVEVYNNTVYSIAEKGTWGSCPLNIGLGSSYSPTPDIKIYNNSFYAIGEIDKEANAEVASAWLIDGDYQQVELYNNNFYSNENIISFRESGEIININFENNSFIKSEINDKQLVLINAYDGSFSNINLLNNELNGINYNYEYGLHASYTRSWEFETDWFLKINLYENGLPVNAELVISNNQGIVFSGTITGSKIFKLPELFFEGYGRSGSVIDYNPYTIQATYNGNQITQNIDLTESKEVSIDFSESSTTSSAIIADHNAVIEFDNGDIPDYWIEEVKNQNFLIQFPGRSHSQQLSGDFDDSSPDTIGGLEMLEDIDPKYNFEVQCFPYSFVESNSLRFVKAQHDGNQWRSFDYECRNDDNDYWSTTTGRQHTLDAASNSIAEGYPFDASMFGWSFHIIRSGSVYDESNNVITFNDERMNAYFLALEEFSQNAPEIEYVYVTAPTDQDTSSYIDECGVDGERVTRYNQEIRDKAILENAVLFDQADIEFHDANMQAPTSEHPCGEGSNIEIRHPDWSVGGFGDCTHANSALCIAKAKAVWWMSARMAGWDGTPACHSSSDCGGNACIQGICQ